MQALVWVVAIAAAAGIAFMLFNGMAAGKDDKGLESRARIAEAQAREASAQASQAKSQNSGWGVLNTVVKTTGDVIPSFL